MRLFLLALLSGVLAGCSKGDDLKSAALKVQVHYEGFRPGCVTLTATDQADASRQVSTNVTVPAGPPPGTLSVAVFRQAGWSNDVELLAVAKEQSCEGAQVATAQADASLAKDGITPVDLSLGATDFDGDGFVRTEDQGTDCNDRDENQKGPTPWYTDADGDKYGSSLLPPVTACTAPSFNSVSNAGDCNDSDILVRPGQEEFRCDGQDDNCNDMKDEVFGVGLTCETPVQNCPGVKACDTMGGTLCFSNVTPKDFFVDEDGDEKVGTLGGTSCTPPSGSKPQVDDCDESSPFRGVGTPEVCDRIDNDCSNVADDGLSCDLAWQPYSDQGAINWNAIATDGAGHIWAAADGDMLAVMDASEARPITCDGDWRAAWVAASGEVFLAGAKGSAGRFARATPSATNCTTADPPASQSLNGLVGIESQTGGTPILYGVTGGGQTFRWVPPALPEQLPGSLSGVALRAISGVGSPDTLLAVGSKNALSTPAAFRFNVASSTWTEETLPTPLSGELRGVHVVNANYAYAVGDNGMALERVNGKWNAMKTIPSAYATRNLLDVVAFGRTAVYVTTTDALNGAAAVLFFNGSDWSPVYTDAKSFRALKSLDAKRPTFIVTAGNVGAAAAFTATPR
ncbi:putative metal-binding motif-containing protein [Corallococcus exercitus]|uniref:putative metal-binding motif-containing protein n=1 Tax=Corallococcus exercitus TaxID=2316736 RepID=UPI0035D51691